jgi:glutamate carboxypeptidase
VARLWEWRETGESILFRVPGLLPNPARRHHPRRMPSRRLIPTAITVLAGLFAGAFMASVQATAAAAANATQVAGLSATERRVAAAIDRHQPRSLALLERAVNINSGTMNFEGVREVARLLQPEFESLGFTVRWMDGGAWGRAGHLLAERIGRDAGPKVLLIGHLDTVFERDSPFQRFERLSDSTALGPGVIDMKGGDVVMLLALRALAEAGAIDRFSFRVVLSGDEEKAGLPHVLSRRDLFEAADWADLAIGLEDGAGDPRTAVIARRGASSWQLRTGGQPAHSSQVFRPEVGDGAIYEAARILDTFRDSLSAEPLLAANPGVILGGTTVTFDGEQSRGTAFGKTNVVAESTVVTGDLRTISLPQREAAKATMRRIVERHRARTGAEITFEDGYPPLAPSEGNRRLLATFDRASRDLGLGAVEGVDPIRAGAADISFAEGRVEQALDGVGVMGTGGHTIAETADLKWLAGNARRVAVTLLRVAEERRRGPR